MRHCPSLIGFELRLARYGRGNRSVIGIAKFDHHEAECSVKQQLRIGGMRLHRDVLSFERRLRRVGFRYTGSVTG
jgi:hypothetical protein